MDIDLESDDRINHNFQEAVRAINNTSANIEQQTSLKLYGLYKQSLFGNNTVQKPYFFYFHACRKWYAWNSEKGKSKDEAKQEYVVLVNDFFGRVYTF